MTHVKHQGVPSFAVVRTGKFLPLLTIHMEEDQSTNYLEINRYIASLLFQAEKCSRDISCSSSSSLSSEFGYKTQSEILALVQFPRLLSRKPKNKEGKWIECSWGVYQKRELLLMRTVNAKVQSLGSYEEENRCRNRQICQKMLIVGIKEM